ncbi:MAG: hypothetical protein LBK71_01240 [Verrucomicrobiales bacterium]|nr:hypothetical protein [Verrucomicrobiales bacterium]
MTVMEIKEAIGKLSHEEFSEVAEFVTHVADDVELDDWERQIAGDMRNGNSVNVDRAIEKARAEGTLLPLSQKPAGV